MGSTSVMTDASGAVVEESANYPFGAARVRYSPRGVEDAYQFAQKERDAESGLDFVGARYYSATLGRFASVEPMALQGNDLRKPSFKLNSYAYATNNPINFIDPTGHDDKSLNQTVAEYAQRNIGKKAVGKGECWDLGEEALKSAGAQTSKDLTPNFGADSDYVWGTPVKDLKNLEPGDILQFRDHVVTITKVTTIKYKDGSTESDEADPRIVPHKRGGVARKDGTIPGHTAIVNGRVDANGAVQVVEQHVRGSHRVETSLLNTADVPPVVATTTAMMRNPFTHKMEQATITTTTTITVTGSVWAYKPKAK
jgi:RHS repeat-associated protein